MQRMGGGSRYTRKQRAGGNDPSCGCDMQAGWPKFLTENIPLPSVGPSLRVGSPEAALTQPTQKGGSSCGIPPIPNYYNGRGMSGGGCAACSGLPLPQPMSGGGQPTVYNSNPVPDACPFPGTGYCGFYARGGFLPNHEGGANYGEPMYLQARLRGGYRPTKKNRAALRKWRKGQSIGFTQTASLKAKGLIPRTSRKNKGTKVVSAKYK